MHAAFADGCSGLHVSLGFALRCDCSFGDMLCMSMALRNLTLHGSVMFTQCQLCFSSECYITLQVWHVCGTGSHNFRSKSCSLQQECKFFCIQARVQSGPYYLKTTSSTMCRAYKLCCSGCYHRMGSKAFLSLSC